MKIIPFILCVLVASVSSYRRGTKPNTLKLVHVLFRHAQRTADEATIYPNDPYKNETYEPFGLGSLTPEGYKTQYALGRALRSRYGNFIGDYSPRILKAISSPYSRTKIAMQLVLAGLFPPVGVRHWNPNLKWQPIDFDVNPRSTDLVFLPHNNCRNFLKLQDEYLRAGIENNGFPELTEISEYLTIKSGWNVTSPLEAFLLYAGLLSEEEWGFQLPDWTNQVYPEPLRSLAIDFVSAVAKDERMKTLSGGLLIKRIIDEVVMKINRAQTMNNVKISLLSRHDFNIISLLATLGIYKPHLPPYAAYILIELHKVNDVYGLKVFYNDYTKPHPELMTLPDCGSFCPLHKFIDIYSKYFATESMCTSLDFIRSET